VERGLERCREGGGEGEGDREVERKVERCRERGGEGGREM